MAAAVTTFLAVGISPTVPTAAAAALAPAATTVPAVGPIDPNTGYPFWYQDATGERYELCFDRSVQPTGLCLAAPRYPDQRPYVAADPALSNLAADPETFWFDATATIDTGGADALFVAAKEATFGGADEAARAGDQISFGRIRIRVANLVVGKTYTVTHPYGARTFVAEDDGTGVGEINYTQDLGCLDVPCDFRKATDSSVTSYLRWDPAVGPAAPVGYVGDPAVPHQVVGSPAGTNFFRVEGTNAGGPGVDVVETDLFEVQGKLWEPTAPMLGLVADGNAVDYGRVPYSAPVDPASPAGAQTVTLTNAGAGTLTMSSVQVTGEDAASFSVVGESCTTATTDGAAGLGAGGLCSVDVAFHPQHAGPLKADLVVESNGADSSPAQRIVLRGVAVDGTDVKDRRATGPLSLEHGFPLWYQDEEGLKLALCDDPADARCFPAPAPPYDPVNGEMAFPANFPDELFWWTADAEIDTANTANGQNVEAQLVLAQEAAFANEVPAAGDQIAFGRIRIRVEGLVPGGEYDVTTPYGDYHFVATDEGRSINYTEDLGCLESGCDFTRANRSNVGPFLVQQSMAADPTHVGDIDAEPGPVTDPGARFAIQGPGVNAGTTDFVVSGRRWVAPQAGTLALKEPSSTLTVDPLLPRVVTLTNVGQGEVADIDLGVGSGFAIIDETCSGAPLAGGTDCTVTVASDGTATTGSLAVSTGGVTAGSVGLRGTVDGGTAAPSTPVLQVANDTGVSPHDGVTRTTGVTFSGAAARGQQVTLLVDGAPVATVDPVGAAWSAGATLTEGRHQVTAAYADGMTSAPATVVVDLTGPGQAAAPALAAASDTGTPGDAVTADLTPVVTGTAPAGTRLVRVLVDGRVVGVATVAADGAWRYVLPPLGQGTTAVTAVAVDAAGNAGPASPPLTVRVDVRVPTVTLPELAPVALGARVGDRVLALVSWTVRDGGQAGTTFSLQASRNGGTFRNVALPRAGATGVEQRLVVGDLYRFRIRATDAAGNSTAWVTGPRLRAQVTQEGGRTVRLRGDWTTRRQQRALGGKVTVADRRGAQATISTRARAVTVVAGTGPNRGRAAVLVNGRRYATVDLYSPAVRRRRAVVTVDGLQPTRTTRVQVRVLGDKRPASRGTRVDLDGFLVVR